MSRSFSPERKVLNEKFQLNGEFLGLVDPKLWLNLFLHVLPPYGCERVNRRVWSQFCGGDLIDTVE